MLNALIPLQKYSDFRGRASRAEFWSFFALSAAVLVAFGVLTGISIDPIATTPPGQTPPTWALAYLFWWVVTAIPWFALQTRRLHDQGRGTWLISFSIAGYVALFANPAAGTLILALFLCVMALPGEPRANRFGEVPGDAGRAAHGMATSGDGETARSLASDLGALAADKFAGSPHKNEFLDEGAICDPQREEHRLPHNEPTGSGTEPEGSNRNQAQPISGSLATPLELLPASPRNELLAAPPEPLVVQPDDQFTVTKTARGFYSYGGYTFVTEEQAEAYAEQIRRQIALMRQGQTERAASTSPQLGGKREQHGTNAHATAATEPDTIDHRETSSTSPASAFPTAGAELSAVRQKQSQNDDKYAVTPTSDGRFLSGGYTFTTQAQAESYANRRRSTAAVATGSAAAPAKRVEPPKPDAGPAERWLEVEPGIKIRRDGKFYVRGYSFATLPEARAAAGRGIPANSAPAAKPAGLLAKIFQQRPPAPVARWIAEPTLLEAGGVSFQGYLVYFGTPSRDHWNGAHRALIDPTLPLARQPDTFGNTLSYWPEFARISPNARRAYLDWLAGGRCDPATPIGYVFLYFYGLERRLIHEQKKGDAPAILAEAQRLLSIYGLNSSFRNYCTNFIEAGELIAGLAAAEPRPSLDLRNGYEIPIGVRLHLGRKVRDGVALAADDALCWTLGHPQMRYPRTPVSRCFDEFTALWRHRFDERFPDGIKVKAPKARLQVSYRAASAEFNGRIAIDDLPDIGAISGPIAKFEALVTECTEALDPLSRHLGRNPDDRHSLFAVALCPAPALSADGKRILVAAREKLFASKDSDGFAQVPLSTVLSVLTGKHAAVAAENRAAALKRMPETLDAMGVGFEPDKRHGPAPTLTDDTILCLFELGEGAQVLTDSQEYRSARTMVEIAVLAANADNAVVDAELQAIARDLGQVTGLGGAERCRLQAHARTMAANPPKLRAAIKRMLELSEAEKEGIVTAAVNAILADQRVLPAEVRFLEGLYKALGKPQDEIYSRLHARTAASASPAAAGTRAPGKIDGEKLQRLRDETMAVSSMLSDIFREEVDIAQQPAAAAETEQPERALPGLDTAHSNILLALLSEPIEFDAFSLLCRQHRLLPEGAVETINDWGFDELGDVAIEHDDLVCVQPHLIDNIRNLADA